MDMLTTRLGTWVTEISAMIDIMAQESYVLNRSTTKVLHARQSLRAELKRIMQIFGHPFTGP
jgi:hypothetical protein